MIGLAGKLKWFGATLTLGLLLAGQPLAVCAQEAVTAQAKPEILVVDRERLFTNSAFGRASIAREEEAARALEAENSRIQAGLVAEEQELTVLRKTLSAEDFATRADAFDQKVERIRAEQDAKARDLTKARDENGKAFLVAVAPVLEGILNRSGAVVLLDKGLVILAVSSIDVTDEAIAEVDKVLAAPTTPAP